MFDVALAMQNLALAAHALGLGTVHVGLVDAKKAAEILRLPAGMVFVEMTPLGYPNEEPKAPARKALEEIVFHDRCGHG
jgi:nitroreductase